MFDYALALLWPLVTKNKWDMTSLPDIAEGFSYVSDIYFSDLRHSTNQNRRPISNDEMVMICIQKQIYVFFIVVCTEASFYKLQRWNTIAQWHAVEYTENCETW